MSAGSRARDWYRVAKPMLVGGLLACSASPESENALGDRYAAEIARTMSLEVQGEASTYLDSLGDVLVKAAKDTVARDWHFYIVADDELNAFAVPGGHIYVNRGLVEAAGDMSELAGVVGHEVGHVVLRHSVEQMRQQAKANVVVTLVCNVTGWCSSDAARVVLNVGGAALFAKYGRAHESAADSVALDYLMRAGIDPRGVPRMFTRLMTARAADPGFAGAFFASHPLEEDRIAASNQRLASRDTTAFSTLLRDDPNWPRPTRRTTGGSR